MTSLHRLSISDTIRSATNFAVDTISHHIHSLHSLSVKIGLFRKSCSNQREKEVFCSALLYEAISLQQIKDIHYDSDDVHLLAKSLQYLLSNLPGSLFGDHNLQDLLEEVDSMDIGGTLSASNGTDDRRESHLDDDVAAIPRMRLQSLKQFIDNLYIAPSFKGRHEHRWKLMAVILQFLKLVSMKEEGTKMSVHAIARLFAVCFESRQYLQRMTKEQAVQPLRCTVMLKVLIYHSFFLFPQIQWAMKDIVVAEKQEVFPFVVHSYFPIVLARYFMDFYIPYTVYTE